MCKCTVLSDIHIFFIFTTPATLLLSILFDVLHRDLTRSLKHLKMQISIKFGRRNLENKPFQLKIGQKSVFFSKIAQIEWMLVITKIC